MRPAALAISLLLACAGMGICAAQELIGNGDFEAGITGWGIWIPDESQAANCRFEAFTESPHAGAGCVRMQADELARFSIGAAGIPVQAGEHYRVSAWVRADAATKVRPKAAGFAIRLNLRQGNADAPGGHLFIELPGEVSRGNAPLESTAALPKKWAKVEAVVEIPTGVDAILPSLFVWWAKGAIDVDDFSMTKIDATVAVTPLTQDSPATATKTNAAPEVIPATGPVTSDADLLATLNLDTAGMGKVKAAATAGAAPDWTALKQAYLDYRRTGSPVRWHMMPSDRPAQPKEKDDSVGDEVLAHHIRNGYGFSPAGADMGKDFNWTFNPVPKTDPAYTDEWTYCNVSRMEFFRPLANAYWQTGDEKYAVEWVALLNDFALKNPLHYEAVAGTPSLWRTLDAAERISISLPDAYFHFRDSPSFTPDANWLYLKINYEHALLLLHGLDQPGRTGNWVATECGALYTIGALFPEFRDAATWRQTAIDRISKELDNVVPPDGFEAELTPTYHFVALNGYRTPLDVARLNGLQVPDEFRSRIMAMYRAPVLVMDQSGRAVATNDSSVIDLTHKALEGLQLGDDPLLAWAASHGQKGKAPPDSDALPYAGFYAMRGGWDRNDAFLFFRAGPVGIGHDHESDLEVVMRAWNKSLLFEPGTYPYDQSEWRRFTINTPSHSTIIVDGKWQHAGKDTAPVSQPTGNPWITTPAFDFVAGTYSAGYQLNTYRPRPFYPENWKGMPDKSVSHTRRVLFLRPYYALVLDTLDGTGTHTFDAHFQLDAPAAILDPATHAAFSQNTSGAQLALYPLELDNLAVDIVKGQDKPLLGWMPVEHRAIPTVRFRKQQAAPAIFATFLYPYQDKAPTFATTPLAVQGDGWWSRSLKTAREKIDIALSKSNEAAPVTLTSPLAGDVQVEASGLVIRQPTGAKTPVFGAWNLKAFRNATVELTAATPASLIFVPQGEKLLLFNAGDDAVSVDIKKPFERSVNFAPKAWTSVSKDGESPAEAPLLFKPLEKSATGTSYADYLKSFPADAGKTPAPAQILIPAETMTLPEKAEKTSKNGSTGVAIARWDAPDTVVAGHVDVPVSGWYRLKVRYCSGGEPLRSVVVNGKAPFAEAEAFSLPSTQGNPPSDGWSNFADDWHEVMLGADAASDGWKFYLHKGPCDIGLRNDSGGLNLNWIALEPAW